MEKATGRPNEEFTYLAFMAALDREITRIQAEQEAIKKHTHGR